LNVAAEYIDRIGKGDIPPKISEEYRGDFNEIKNNLNLCIDAIQLLIDDSAVLANACHEGQLDVRCDASKLQGAYRVIIEGVNRSLESVIVQIKETLRVAKEYANLNFTARVNPSLRMPGDWLEFKNALDNIGLHVSTAIGLVNTILMNSQQVPKNDGKHPGSLCRSTANCGKHRKGQQQLL
jgi:methyl-accepting chemotaxis protein